MRREEGPLGRVPLEQERLVVEPVCRLLGQRLDQNEAEADSISQAARTFSVDDAPSR